VCAPEIVEVVGAAGSERDLVVGLGVERFGSDTTGGRLATDLADPSVTHARLQSSRTPSPLWSGSTSALLTTLLHPTAGIVRILAPRTARQVTVTFAMGDERRIADDAVATGPEPRLASTDIACRLACGGVSRADPQDTGLTAAIAGDDDTHKLS